MKRSRFSEEQIIGILTEHEARISVAYPAKDTGGREYAAKVALGDAIFNSLWLAAAPISTARYTLGPCIVL